MTFKIESFIMINYNKNILILKLKFMIRLVNKLKNKLLKTLLNFIKNMNTYTLMLLGLIKLG